jgi:hypothetical protein
MVQKNHNKGKERQNLTSPTKLPTSRRRRTMQNSHVSHVVKRVILPRIVLIERIAVAKRAMSTE